MTLRKKIIICGFIILFVPLVLALLLYFGVLHINNPSTKVYPIRGVDISSYQGEVDWETLSEQNISFAYIKATEGLTEKYGMKPIIYVSDETYKTIVQGNFDDCKLWYRSVYSSIPRNVDWTFWQYSNRHHLKGYNGSERYIDMNVFNGSADDFYK